MKKKKRIAVSLVLAIVVGLSIACEDMLDEMLREIIGSVGVDAMRVSRTTDSPHAAHITETYLRGRVTLCGLGIEIGSCCLGGHPPSW